MQKGIVKIADGKLETRNKLNLFLSTQKMYYSERKIKTMDDAISFAIDEAQRVPELIKELEELRSEAWILQKDKDLLLEDLQKAKARIKEIEENKNED